MISVKKKHPSKSAFFIKRQSVRFGRIAVLLRMPQWSFQTDNVLFRQAGRLPLVVGRGADVGEYIAFLFFADAEERHGSDTCHKHFGTVILFLCHSCVLLIDYLTCLPVTSRRTPFFSIKSCPFTMTFLTLPEAASLTVSVPVGVCSCPKTKRIIRGGAPEPPKIA